MKVRVKKAVGAPVGLAFKPVEPDGKPGDEIEENGVRRKLELRNFLGWRFQSVADDLGEGRLRIRQRDVGFKEGMELFLPDDAIQLFGKQRFAESFEILDVELAPAVKLQSDPPRSAKADPKAFAADELPVPTDELMEPMEHVLDEDLLMACRTLQSEGKDLTKSGRPKVDAVRELLGRDVTAAEIDDAMAVLEA